MTFSEQYRVWAEIDLDALTENYKTAVQAADGAMVMPVIKADAYGHGAVMAAKVLSDASWFGVATPEEALELRQNGIKQEILLLGVCPVGRVGDLCAAGITLSIPDIGTARRYLSVFEGGLSSKNRQPLLKGHIKLDTGMKRLGLPYTDALREVMEILALPGLQITGVFTHFALADCLESGFTEKQTERFAAIRQELCKEGYDQLLYHAANSAALLSRPETRFDMVRAGILLYGSNPLSGDAPALRPVMTLKTSVVHLTAVSKGEGVSYGHAWRAERDSMIAAVSVGYADGLSRRLSGRISMLLHGKRVPQVGRICMDICMLDVTGLPEVSIGDCVTVFGRDGGDSVTAETHAGLSDTIPYEIFCAVGRRVPRVFKDNGRWILPELGGFSGCFHSS